MVLRVDASKALRALARVAPNVDRNVRRAFAESGREFVGEMVKRTSGGNPLHARTKRLKDSFGYQVRGQFPSVELAVFSAGVPYARLQEYGTAGLPGGVMRAKKPGGFLTIPIDDNLTAGGVAKITSAREAIEKRKAFFVRTKSGRLYIVAREGEGKDADVKFLFRLVKQVTVTARLGFRETWQKLAPARTARLQQAIGKAVRESFHG